MDQRIAIGTGPERARPIHGACLVAACWCRSTTAGARPAAGRAERRRRTIGSFEGPTTTLTDIALRSVGLPVV